MVNQKSKENGDRMPLSWAMNDGEEPPKGSLLHLAAFVLGIGAAVSLVLNILTVAFLAFLVPEGHVHDAKKVGDIFEMAVNLGGSDLTRTPTTQAVYITWFIGELLLFAFMSLMALFLTTRLAIEIKK